MFDQLMSADVFPFTVSLTLLFSLLVLEVIFAFLGGTILGAGGDSVDLPEVDAPDLGADLDGVDIDAAELEMPDLDAGDVEVASASAPSGILGGVLAWLGIGRVPAAIWLASVLLGFGLSGLTIQTVAPAILGAALPPIAAAIPAGVIAIGFARQFGTVFARMLPKTETQATSERHLGRRTGVVSQGTAARGRPAEVRVTDRYGNTHYLRAEPLRDETEIPAGTKVVVLRHRRHDGYLLVPITT